MLADDLIEESGNRPDSELDDERRTYFAVTKLGEQIAAAEARRLEVLVAEARGKRLLAKPAFAPRRRNRAPTPKRS